MQTKTQQTYPTYLLSLEDLEDKQVIYPEDLEAFEAWRNLDERTEETGSGDEWIEGAELVETDLADVEQRLAEQPAPPALQNSLPLAICLAVGVVAFLAWVIL